MSRFFPWLFSLSAAERVSVDILFGLLRILAKSDIPDEPPKHIWKILSHEIGTL